MSYKINYTNINQFGSSGEKTHFDISNLIPLSIDGIDENIYQNIFQENIIHEQSLKWGAVHLDDSNIEQLVDILYKFTLLKENNCDFLLPFPIESQIKENESMYRQAIKTNIEENYTNFENGIVLITYGDQIAGYYNWRIIDSIEWIYQEMDLDDETVPIENNGKKWIEILDFFKTRSTEKNILQFLANQLCIEDETVPERTLKKFKILFINSLCSFSKLLIDKPLYNQAYEFNMDFEGGIDVGMAIWDDILYRSRKISNLINLPILICLDKTLSSQDYHFQNGFRPLVPSFNMFDKEVFESQIKIENELQRLNVEELNNNNTEKLAIFKYVDSIETLRNYDINFNKLFLDLNLDHSLQYFDKDNLKSALKSLIYFAIDPRLIDEIYKLGDVADPIGSSTLYFYEELNEKDEGDDEINFHIKQDLRDSPNILEKILKDQSLNKEIFKKRSYSDLEILDNEYEELNRSQSMPNLSGL